MAKEVLIIVTKQLDCNGNVRFLLSSNKTSATSWFHELPPQKDAEHDHKGFNFQLQHVLHSCGLPPGNYDFKTLYNKEYKTEGTYVVTREKNQGHRFGFKDAFDHIALNETEILHFMKLLRNFS